jgi:hypothetical protein
MLFVHDELFNRAFYFAEGRDHLHRWELDIFLKNP